MRSCIVLHTLHILWACVVFSRYLVINIDVGPGLEAARAAAISRREDGMMILVARLMPRSAAYYLYE
jgi:hypothetical protein